MRTRPHSIARRQLDQVDVSGRTALHQAVQEGSINALRELIGREVNVDAKDMGDETALHIAAYSGNVCTNKLLTIHCRYDNM